MAEPTPGGSHAGRSPRSSCHPRTPDRQSTHPHASPEAWDRPSTTDGSPPDTGRASTRPAAAHTAAAHPNATPGGSSADPGQCDEPKPGYPPPPQSTPYGSPPNAPHPPSPSSRPITQRSDRLRRQSLPALKPPRWVTFRPAHVGDYSDGADIKVRCALRKGGLRSFQRCASGRARSPPCTSIR